MVNPKHYLGIDALRFIAASLVVWFHHGFYLTAHPTGRPNKMSEGLVDFPELNEYSFFGYIGVQIFFVISGFVIAFSGEKSTAFNFFTSRVVRLGPGVWICATMTLFAIFSVGFGSLEEIRLFVQSILFVPIGTWIDGAYWTLGIEIAFYCLVGALIAANKFVWVTKLAIVIGAVSSLYWILLAINALGFGGDFGQALFETRRNRWLDLALVHHGLFFGLGVLLWSELVKKQSFMNTCWSLFFCVTGCLQIIVTSESFTEKGHNFSPFIACLIWVLSIVAIIFSVKFNALVHRAPQWFLRSLKTVGLMTFPLYLLHQVAGNVLMGAVVKAGGDRWTALVVAVAVTLLASWCVAKHLEPVLQTHTRRAMFKVRDWWLGRTSTASQLN